MAASGDPAVAIRVGMSVISRLEADWERTGCGAADEDRLERVESIETVLCAVKDMWAR